VSDLSVLQEGRARRRAAQRQADRRRRRLAAGFVAVLVVALAALLTLGAGRTSGPGTSALRRAPPPAPHRVAIVRRALIAPTYGVAPAPASEQVQFKKPFHVASAILFDVWTGRVLWAKDPARRRTIASLTKMMTALVVATRSSPRDQVVITRAAVHFSGSGVGLLPLGKRVGLVALLYGLLLPSGNDAAIALAQHVAGTERRFVALMNARAQDMQLRCTHFASASGIVDRDNYSCTTDLAVLAHAVLEQPLLRPIVAARSAIIPFPIKGRKLYLYNNNPLLLSAYPGTDGVKTGYTVASGPCLVATVRRGNAWLGVVLLDSVNPGAEAQKLFNAGFAKLRGS
jgi:serine-type D-Ala-D-Ala carboxypeptidase (penicillin-binding protein 5/6)